jgi:hypothetical protein
MWGVKRAVAAGVVVMSVTVALATSASAQIGVPDFVDDCLAAEDVGACFTDEFAQAPPPGAIPDFVEDCLAAEDVGACFADEFGAQIPEDVAECLAARNIGACFAGTFGGEIPGDVADCLEAENIGACFSDLFAQAPPPGAGIPGPVQACLDKTDPLQRAACFRNLGG